MEKTTWLQIRSDPDTKEKIDQLAVEDMRSVSQMIRWLIQQEWLRRHPEDAKISIEKEIKTQ